MYRESPNLSPNRAIILIRLVVENPLVVEDQPYFLGEALRLQSSLTILNLAGRTTTSLSFTSERVLWGWVAGRLSAVGSLVLRNRIKEHSWQAGGKINRGRLVASQPSSSCCTLSPTQFFFLYHTSKILFFYYIFYYEFTFRFLFI